MSLYQVVFSGGLNARAAPSLTSPVTGTLSYGDTVKALTISGDWIQHSQGWTLRTKDGIGYLVPPRWEVVWEGGLNARETASTTAAVRGTLRTGEIITALDQQGDWILHSEGWTLIGTRSAVHMRNLSNVWEVTSATGVIARAKPSLESPPVIVLSNGEQITAISEDGLWIKHSRGWTMKSRSDDPSEQYLRNCYFPSILLANATAALSSLSISSPSPVAASTPMAIPPMNSNGNGNFAMPRSPLGISVPLSPRPSTPSSVNGNNHVNGTYNTFFSTSPAAAVPIPLPSPTSSSSLPILSPIITAPITPRSGSGNGVIGLSLVSRTPPPQPLHNHNHNYSHGHGHHASTNANNGNNGNGNGNNGASSTSSDSSMFAYSSPSAMTISPSLPYNNNGHGNGSSSPSIPSHHHGNGGNGGNGSNALSINTNLTGVSSSTSTTSLTPRSSFMGFSPTPLVINTDHNPSSSNHNGRGSGNNHSSLFGAPLQSSQSSSSPPRLMTPTHSSRSAIVGPIPIYASNSTANTIVTMNGNGNGHHHHGIIGTGSPSLSVSLSTSLPGSSPPLQLSSSSSSSSSIPSPIPSPSASRGSLSLLSHHSYSSGNGNGNGNAIASISSIAALTAANAGNSTGTLLGAPPSSTPMGLKPIATGMIIDHEWLEYRTADGRLFWYSPSTMRTEWSRPTGIATHNNNNNSGHRSSTPPLSLSSTTTNHGSSHGNNGNNGNGHIIGASPITMPLPIGAPSSSPRARVGALHVSIPSNSSSYNSSSNTPNGSSSSSSSSYSLSSPNGPLMSRHSPGSYPSSSPRSGANYHTHTNNNGGNGIGVNRSSSYGHGVHAALSPQPHSHHNHSSQQSQSQSFSGRAVSPAAGTISVASQWSSHAHNQNLNGGHHATPSISGHNHAYNHGHGHSGGNGHMLHTGGVSMNHI